MNPDNSLFHASIVGPTNSGKTRYMVNPLRTTFQGRFYYIVLLFPTFIHNTTILLSSNRHMFDPKIL